MLNLIIKDFKYENYNILDEREVIKSSQNAELASCS